MEPYFDLYTKGGKLRRLYIPKKLRTETIEWLEESHRSSGYLFLNRYGERIATRGISQQLKNYAEKYGLDMQKAASNIVGGFMENIFGKGLKPWQRDAKAGQAP